MRAGIFGAGLWLCWSLFSDVSVTSMRNVAHYPYQGSVSGDVFVLKSSRGVVNLSNFSLNDSEAVVFAQADTVTTDRNLLLVNSAQEISVSDYSGVYFGLPADTPPVLLDHITHGEGGLNGNMVVLMQAPSFNFRGAFEVYGGNQVVLTTGGVTEGTALGAPDDAMIFRLDDAVNSGVVNTINDPSDMPISFVASTNRSDGLFKVSTGAPLMQGAEIAAPGGSVEGASEGGVSALEFEESEGAIILDGVLDNSGDGAVQDDRSEEPDLLERSGIKKEEYQGAVFDDALEEAVFGDGELEGLIDELESLLESESGAGQEGEGGAHQEADSPLGDETEDRRKKNEKKPEVEESLRASLQDFSDA